MFKLLVALTVVVLGFLALNVSGKDLNLKSVPEEVKSGKAILLDVREEGELDSGIAEGATWIPTSKFSQLWEEKLANQKDKNIYLYCAVGGRAGKWTTFLKSKGYKAENIGGFRDWKAAGLPVTEPKK